MYIACYNFTPKVLQNSRSKERCIRIFNATPNKIYHAGRTRHETISLTNPKETRSNKIENTNWSSSSSSRKTHIRILRNLDSENRGQKICRRSPPRLYSTQLEKTTTHTEEQPHCLSICTISDSKYKSRSGGRRGENSPEYRARERSKIAEPKRRREFERWQKAPPLRTQIGRAHV